MRATTTSASSPVSTTMSSGTIRRRSRLPRRSRSLVGGSDAGRSAARRERRAQPRGQGDSRRSGVPRAPEDLSEQRRPALWVNRLSGPGSKGLSGQRRWSRRSPPQPRITRSSEAPAVGVHDQPLSGPAQPVTDGWRAHRGCHAPATSQRGDPGVADRRRGATAQADRPRHVVSGAEFRADEVTSFFANYMHPTCKELLAAGMHEQHRTPTASQLAAALASLCERHD